MDVYCGVWVNAGKGLRGGRDRVVEGYSGGRVWYRMESTVVI